MIITGQEQQQQQQPANTLIMRLFHSADCAGNIPFIEFPPCSPLSVVFSAERIPSAAATTDEAKPADEHGTDNPFNYSSVKEVFLFPIEPHLRAGEATDDTLSNLQFKRSTGNMTDDLERVGPWG